jgi:hypothetical protein
MRSLVVLAVWIASATAAVGVAAIAGAGGPPNVPTVPNVPNATSYQFQSPDGNIACTLGPSTNGGTSAACDIGDHTYTPPSKPADCHLGWGDRFSLQQGNAAMMDCHGDTLRVPDLPTLNYGQTRSVGSIMCDSEVAGMTCTDNSSGHFFRVSAGSYQLG